MESKIRQGSQVEMTLEPGRIVLAPVEPPTYSLEALLAEVRDDNLHEEIGFGSPKGRETW